MKNLINLFAASLLLFTVISCTSGTKEIGADISTETEQIEAGKVLFEQNCSTCHNFNQSAIGPNLSGLTRKVESEWIRGFIKNPQEKIDQGDERAKELYEKYKVYMPAFPTLKEEDINALLSYMHTYERAPVEVNDSEKLEDPIPEKISKSDLNLELEYFAQIPASDKASPLAKITKMECEPVSGRFFVQDQHGIMYEIRDSKPYEYFNLKSYFPDFVSKPGLATGFGSYAFHPDFTNNGLLYTSHTEKPGNKPKDFDYADSIKVTMEWVITEWTLEDPNAETFKGTGRELMRIDVVTQIHGVQELAFNPNASPGDEDYGLLFIGIGDGGSAESGFSFIADHQGSKIWSSIMRIDPSGSNSANGKYGIPASNPFAGVPGKLGEIYAYGFRNPNRIFWDPKGRMLATEIGHHNIEELNLIEPGKFYGWPIREGTFVINPFGNMSNLYPLPADDSLLNATYPLLQFDHDEGNAIIAGYFPEGGPFKGKLLFGDIPSGKLFFSDLNQSQPEILEIGVVYDGKETTLRDLCQNGRVDLKYGQDCQGQVYVMTKADGKIYKIINQ
ncbi:PQQ-dependent sugar dehydrogenase [Algoriphagus machipongonensis]|uniref:Protein up-regulated by thyroid hormone-putative PQQ-dependent glucose dehydrogenase n=1 Tax=Algoriphagus machipongonensis TaxID=388413 RepID=A3HUH7_9BACT|nr:PQQ-dependent sugar dehydrogenase [Algoriphagus machipongonensis]EAZ81799.1 protein up-regulated by thyroid hormone-putative PQQ-dependent glucose dehydrogenase [Algoriphagus machipongonensis]